MTRLICESCDHGYAPTAPSCPWCGAGSFLAHESNVDSVVDTECLPDYWLARFSTGESFPFFAGHPLDIAGLVRALSRYRIVTFNGQHYDNPMLAFAVAGFSVEQLREASDAIIRENLQPWDVLRRYGVAPLDWMDTIDLFDVAPGQSSLKAYGGKMHSRKLQDLPYDPNEPLGHWGRRFVTFDYCGNDLAVTADLLATFPTQIKLREDMSAEFGVDLRSKSDAQIAEAVMKSILPFKVERPYIAPGSTFHYQPPEWLAFQTPYLADVARRMASLPFAITHSGGVAPAYDNHLVDWGKDQQRLDAHGQWVKRPAGWQHETVRIGGMEYTVGIGGLHSNEAVRCLRSDDSRVLRDSDVRGYYPSLMIRLGVYPPQIGPVFCEHFKAWKALRDEQKAISEDKSQPADVRARAKKQANSRKTLGNGTFGKLGSMWSIFYAPAEMIQVTVTGQLGLLMLIETLERSGVPVVSANTDGIVTHCPRGREWIRDACIAWWEATTGFEMEHAEYRMLASRDVNSYIAIKDDGEIKLKGEYAPPEPGPSGWPNPSGQICVDAVVALLRDGTPLRQTIEACQDVRRFVYVYAVRGGGSYCPDGALPATTTQKAMLETCELDKEFVKAWGKESLIAAYDAAREREAARREYLGKVVRWYFAQGSQACIVTPAGGRVARTHGCRPLMTLPDDYAVPADLDREWYVTEAESILKQVGL